MTMEGFETQEFNAEVPVVEGTAEAVAVAGKGKKSVVNLLTALAGAGIEVSEEYAKAEENKEYSTSEFCRKVFTDFNMSRRQISDAFDINYRTVYGACANMKNDAPETTKGRSASEATVLVNADGEVYALSKDGVAFVNGKKLTESINMVDFVKTGRTEFILSKVAEGMSNADIANLLQVSHGVVYNATKDLEGRTSQRDIMITVDGVEIKRSAYIKQLFAEGKTRPEIKEIVGCEYNVVYAATKTEKAVEEKLSDAIAAVAKYMDLVSDKESFKSAIAILELATIDEEVEADTDAEANVEVETEVELG